MSVTDLDVQGTIMNQTELKLILMFRRKAIIKFINVLILDGNTCYEDNKTR